MTCPVNTFRIGASVTDPGFCLPCTEGAQQLEPTTTWANGERCKEPVLFCHASMSPLPSTCINFDVRSHVPDSWTMDVLIPLLAANTTIRLFEVNENLVQHWTWPTNKTVEGLLMKTLKSNTVLMALRLVASNIRDAEATLLAALANLKYLKLINNPIGAAGAMALGKALKTNTLWQLYLDRTGEFFEQYDGKTNCHTTIKKTCLKDKDKNTHMYQIGDVGATALASGLVNNKHLLDFVLLANAIGDVGAAALAKSLEHNTVLKNLNLFDNQIGNAGAFALAESLKKNNALKNLHLGWNFIGEAGIAALMAVANDNHLLEITFDNQTLVAPTIPTIVPEITQQPTQPQPNQPTKKTKTWKWVVGGLGLAVVVALGSFGIWLCYKAQKPALTLLF